MVSFPEVVGLPGEPVTGRHCKGERRNGTEAAIGFRVAVAGAFLRSWFRGPILRSARSGHTPALGFCRLSKRFMQIHSGPRPLALDCPRRCTQRFGRVGYGHPPEEAALDDAPHSGVVGLESLKGLLDREHSRDLRLDHGCVVAEGHPDAFATPFRRRPTAGVVDEDSTHRLRTEREELGSAVPYAALDTGQLHVGFVDECRSVDRTSTRPGHEVVVRDPTEVVIDELHELVEGLVVALAPAAGEASDFSPVGVGHESPSVGERVPLQARDRMSRAPRSGAWARNTGQGWYVAMRFAGAARRAVPVLRSDPHALSPGHGRRQRGTEVLT